MLSDDGLSATALAEPGVPSPLPAGGLNAPLYMIPLYMTSLPTVRTMGMAEPAAFGLSAEGVGTLLERLLTDGAVLPASLPAIGVESAFSTFGEPSVVFVVGGGY